MERRNSSMTTRNFKIYFRKTIVQKDEGLFSTPCTQQIQDLIRKFCTEKNIEIVSLVVNDPFSDSIVKIRGTREQCDALFDFLKKMQDDYFFSSVNK